MNRVNALSRLMAIYSSVLAAKSMLEAAGNDLTSDQWDAINDLAAKACDDMGDAIKGMGDVCEGKGKRAQQKVMRGEG